MFTRTRILQVVLVTMAVYFIVTAAAHFFGLTLFPFYESALYSPYHDTLLALCDIIFCLLFLSVARNPVKNIDTLHIIIVSLGLALIFNIGILKGIPFAAMGSHLKFVQTEFELGLNVGALILTILLRPQQN